MSTSQRILAIAIGGAVAVCLGAGPEFVGNSVRAQSPQPVSRVTNLPELSLVPLTLLNVGVDNLAQPLTSPTGISRGPAEFFLPRNFPKGGSKEVTLTTSGGNVSVRFFDSVPAGVPATAFQWEQSELPAGNAVGRLRYNGCAGCPDSFTLHLSASSNNTVETSVKINLTTSSGRPVTTSVSADGGSDVQPRFQIRFEPTTFETQDSQVVATYPSGLKYRLPVDSSSQLSQGIMRVVVPRLEVGRDVKLSLINPYGSSGGLSITLPQENSEHPIFEQVNASGEFPDSASVNDTFSVKHSNSGLSAGSGSDDIPINPLATSSACDQRDFIYLSASATWLDNNDHPSSALGTVTIGRQPPANALLRTPNNVVHVNWTLNALTGDKFYQVAFRGVEVVGVCSERVVH